jgi:hypothetical protein
MTTLTATRASFNTSTQTISLASRYNVFIKKLEFSYFGIIAMAILISSCLGSIATMKIFEHNAPLWQFIVSLGFTMANLVACISQAPMKWVINLFAASILVNTVLLLLNLI